jgi:hypothetical protein
MMPAVRQKAKKWLPTCTARTPTIAVNGLCRHAPPQTRASNVRQGWSAAWRARAEGEIKGLSFSGSHQKGDAMTKLMLAAALLLGATAALAGTKPPGPPEHHLHKKNPALYIKCHELAKERGWLRGGIAKGAIKPSKFFGDCMRGEQS